MKHAVFSSRFRRSSTSQESCPVRGCCRGSLRKASCREDQGPLLIANVTVEEVLEDDAEAAEAGRANLC